MRKLLLCGVSSLLLVPYNLRCAGQSEAEKAAAELDKIYQDTSAPQTVSEFTEILQAPSKISSG